MRLPAGDLAGTCEGFVLAGGRSSRMGKDKSLVSFNGVPLVRCAIEILRAAGLDPHIAGARVDLSPYAPAVADDPAHAGLGPLAGICPALEVCSARFAVFIPVDLPLLPPGLVSYLVHHAQVTESAITLASICGFVETFPVVIARDAAPMLKASLRSEDRKCLNAFRRAAEALSRPCSAVPVELLLQAGQICDPDGLPPRAWFLSINNTEDLAEAEAFLRPQPDPDPLFPRTSVP